MVGNVPVALGSSQLPDRVPAHCNRGRSRRRYLARRLEILRAAGNEFRLRGFAETGMRDIAAAADLSPANLYNYFRGKHEILFFCQDLSLDRMLAALERARRLRSNAATRLRFVIVAHMCCVLDEIEGAAAHLFTSTLPTQMQRVLLVKRDRYEKGVRQLIANGMRSGEFVSRNPALAARAMLGALNWSVRWFNPHGALTAAEIADEFADYLIRGLLAKPAAAERQSGRLGRESLSANTIKPPSAAKAGFRAAVTARLKSWPLIRHLDSKARRARSLSSESL
jgi:AcrR family transcriptional regulator